MCRQTAQGKDMSYLWIIVCVLYSYSQTDSQTFHIVENKTDWYTASQTCTMQQGRLPGVNIYDHRLKLKDLSDTKNISSPFWIAATYEIMNYNHCEPYYVNTTGMTATTSTIVPSQTVYTAGMTHTTSTMFPPQTVYTTPFIAVSTNRMDTSHLYMVDSSKKATEKISETQTIANLCSDTFCQTIAISSGKQNIEWRPCWEYNNFSCAISLSEIYQEEDFKWGFKNWPSAFEDCKKRNLNLATRENAQFRERVLNTAKTFWLDDMSLINLAPDIRVQNRTCFYSFNGIIHEGNCSNTSMTTVCILVSNNVQNSDDAYCLQYVSSLNSVHTKYDIYYCHYVVISVSTIVKTTGMTPTTSIMVPSQTVYTAGMTHTTSTMFPSQTVYTAGMTHTTSTIFPSQTKYTEGMTHTTSTMVPSQTKYTEGMTHNTSIMVPSQTVYTAGMTHTTSTMVPSQTVYTEGMTHTTSTMVPSQTVYTEGMTHNTSTMVPSQTVYTEGMTHNTSTMVPSQTVYTEGMTHNTSTMVPSQTVYTTGMTHTAGYSITNKPVITLSTKRLDTSHSYMLDSTKKPTEKTSEKQTKGIWPILGSALGGFVVIIIVVLMIIIVLRRRRMKNDPEKAFNSNANNKPATKNMSKTKPTYDTVLGESFALEATIATSTRVSTAQEEEPVIYARPQKVKTNCRNPIDVPFSIKQPTDEKENTGLYNVVQKGKKSHGIPNTFVHDHVLGKDYYDISFTEPEKEEAVENVYNKANFNHSGRDEDQTVNMYDKANFRHEILENNTGNDYDEANFHHEILENNTGNHYDEANFRNDVRVRNSDNEYEKEMFHRPGSSNYD